MKKLLFFAIAIFSIIFFTNCPKVVLETPAGANVSDTIRVKSDSGYVTVIRQRRYRQVVITYQNPNDIGRTNLHNYLISKRFKLLETCNCSDKVELWEYPVGAVPDGADVKTQSGGSGGNMVINHVVRESQPDSGLEKLQKKPINLENTYPQVQNPHTEILLAITDSGVDDNNGLLTNLPSHLFKNLPNSMYCGSKLPEGRAGMNILRNTGGEPSSEPEDLDGHGTFIGGIIAGMGKHDGVPIGTSTGSSENVNIKQIHAKIIRGRDLSGDLFSSLCGVHYAINKDVRVINASWRVITQSRAEEQDVKDAFYPTLEEIRKKDILIVAAAGNERLNLDIDGKAWPAAFAKPVGSEPNYSGHVLSVGAWDLNPDSTRVICYFSNRGSFVDIYAPGIKIISTGLGNNTVMGQGTSYATPFVARTAAILRGLYPKVASKGIKNHIITYGDRALGGAIRQHNHKSVILEGARRL
jgi:Subtilase family